MTSDQRGTPTGAAASSKASDIEAFRQSLSTWLSEHLSDEVVQAGHRGIDHDGHLEVLRDWNHQLADDGWAAISWPSEYGGRGAGVDEQLVYLEEMSRADAPGPINVIGVSNIAPAIMSFGTEEQRSRFLTSMLRGDEIWCQGMSEPDAGSDLASLRTAAVKEGDSFVVNGQKTWNSFGRLADWCQLYVRTDPDAPKHKGITCLLVDMSSPGIEVRPMQTMSGEYTFSELFFEDVVVPASAMLGPYNEGWRVAMTTLSFERAGVARLHLSLSKKLDHLLRDARASGVTIGPTERDRLAALWSKVACMRWTTTRELQSVGAGGQPAPALGSLIKLMWGQAEQELADLAMHVLGQPSTMGHWAYSFAAAPQCTIAGGTSEINRNIVAEQGLRLPR